MPTVKEVLERESIFDAAILKHGFTDYMRDYELIVQCRIDQELDIVYKYHFIGCVEAHYETAFGSDYKKSLSDNHVLSLDEDFPVEEEPEEGFFWGTRWAGVYPGLQYIENGDRALYWSKQLGRIMHEVTIETNVYFLRLVFADIRFANVGRISEMEREKDFLLPCNEETSDGGVK
ncbi:MAG TPA: hypothetical protein VK141_01180 [Nitrosomonas sp.]|nr:hypothetical protein [Nitrosomonas sp.]